MAESYSKLTVVKLKEELKARNLSTAGLKAQLVARLEEDDTAKTTEDVSTTEDTPIEGPNTSLIATDTHVENAASVQSTDAPDIINAQKEGEEADELPVSAEVGDAVTTEEKALAEPVDAIIKQDGPVQREPVSTEPRDVPMSDGAPEGTTAEAIDTIPTELEPTEMVPREPVVSQEAEMQEESDGLDANAVANKVHEEMTSEQAATTSDHTGPSQVLGTPVSERPSQQPESIKATETIQLDTQASVGFEEVVDDSRKRKRRSQSPQLQTQDAALKRLKGEDGSPVANSTEAVDTAKPQVDISMEDGHAGSEPAPSPAKPHAADARFKGLFAAQAPAPQPKQTIHEVSEDRDVAPAIHPATAALYIRNLQRPLQLPVLREHLLSLAQASNSSPSMESVVELFVDTIKSHALVMFSSISAASRVRLALHDDVWPDEKGRRRLWVDFIPEDKVKEWIEVEHAAAGTKPPKRYEVTYEEEEGGIAAYLKEAVGPQRGPLAQGTRNGPPTATIAKPIVPRGDPGRGFKQLDDLFMSTTTKPKLYFQPVSDSIRDRRLDLLAGGRGGGRGDEMRRFSFEDDIVVDKGPEYGFGGRNTERRGRGGYRGGFESRGGFRGDSWRSGR
jgi:hypothetical protein